MAQKKFREYNQDQINLFPLNFGELVPETHMARVINTFVDGLSLSLLTKYFDEKGTGRPSYHPRVMMKLLLFGYTNQVYSSRKLEAFSTESIPCLWLLGGSQPDHSTISRFRSTYFLDVFEEVFVQMVLLLVDKGFLKLDDYVLDGTKIEASANKHKMVYRKNTERYSGQVREKVKEILAEINAIDQSDNQNPIKHSMNSEEIRQKANQISEDINTDLSQKDQKKIATRSKWLKEKADKLQEYENQLETLEKRNSYSKTDTDATLMKMKNDELRPAYNVQVGTSGEFITGVDIHQNSGDQMCVQHHMDDRKELFEKEDLPEPSIVTMDGGYGTEANFEYFEKKQIKANIKFAGYYKEAKANFKNDPFQWQNMPYHEDGDYFECPNNQKIEFVKFKRVNQKAGYESHQEIYKCKRCTNCPFKEECITTKWNDGYREITANKNFERHKQRARALIKSDEGGEKMRMRGHNIETVFGHFKENLGFRRFLLRGLKKVGAEMLLLSIGYNLMKMNNKQMNAPEQKFLLLFLIKKAFNPLITRQNSSQIKFFCQFSIFHKFLKKTTFSNLYAY